MNLKAVHSLKGELLWCPPWWVSGCTAVFLKKVTCLLCVKNYYHGATEMFWAAFLEASQWLRSGELLCTTAQYMVLGSAVLSWEDRLRHYEALTYGNDKSLESSQTDYQIFKNVYLNNCIGRHFHEYIVSTSLKSQRLKAQIKCAAEQCGKFELILPTTGVWQGDESIKLDGQTYRNFMTVSDDQSWSVDITAPPQTL